MKRREFLLRTACTAGAAWLNAAFPRCAHALTLKPLARKFSASDTVTLGKTGIQTSRLAMGTGTVGVGHHSHQTALGIKGLSDLFAQRLRPRSPLFRLRRQLRQPSSRRGSPQHVSRDKVTVLTKTWARDAASARADLERFRRELGTDHIHICLMHCLTEGD
jgi:hypothetical protein